MQNLVRTSFQVVPREKGDESLSVVSSKFPCFLLWPDSAMTKNAWVYAHFRHSFGYRCHAAYTLDNTICSDTLPTPRIGNSRVLYLTLYIVLRSPRRSWSENTYYVSRHDRKEKPIELYELGRALSSGTKCPTFFANAGCTCFEMSAYLESKRCIIY